MAQYSIQYNNEWIFFLRINGFIGQHMPLINLWDYSTYANENEVAFIFFEFLLR